MLDLKSLLAKILSKGEYKTLLWTNPSPTSAMSAQQLVASGADAYDYIEVVFKTAHVYDGWFTAKAPYVSGTHITLFAPTGSTGEFTGTIMNAVRTISMNNGVLSADSAGTLNTSGFSTNNNMCIPVYIYGIKYGGGYLTSKFYAICSHLERWWEHVRFKGVVGENIKHINWVKAVCHLLSDCEHNPDFKYRWLNTKHHASKWSSYYVFRTWLQNQYNKGCFNWSVQACYARRLCFECCKSLLLHLYNKRFNRQLLYEHRRVLVQHKCSMEREHRVQGFWSRSIQQNKYSHITIPQRGCLAC